MYNKLKLNYKNKYILNISKIKMPKFLSYYETKNYYAKYGCTIAVDIHTFQPNVTKNKIPYHCPKGHLITNLTKNNFNTRINQGLNPCKICQKNIRVVAQELKVIKALKQKGCILKKFGSRRRIIYECHCGSESKTYQQNVLKESWVGCSLCQNPFLRPEIQQRIKETNKKKYGVSNPFQAKVVKDKIKETNKKKYGCENVMHNRKIFSKNMSSAFRTKKYVFPNGREELVQGYENRCLDIILNEFDENDIIVDNMKKTTIKYLCPIKNKICLYIPDIEIPSQKIIIEVKSDYYYEKDKEKNEAKFKATVKAGYILRLYVFDHHDLVFMRTYSQNDEKNTSNIRIIQQNQTNEHIFIENVNNIVNI
jgi:hypothetical protein